MACVSRIALCCFYMSLTWITIKGIVSDPCNNHSTLDAVTLGSRNEKCPRPIPAQRLCDFRLEPAWYTIPFNGYLLDKCPAIGSCGTDFPAWINGKLPSDTDGVVNRTCCIKRGVDCCAGNVTIQVKKCANKYVYYLPSLQECDSVYCISTNLTCEQTTTSTVSTTTATTHSSNEFGSSGSCDDKLTRILIGICIGALALLCGVSGVCLYLICKLYSSKNKARIHASKENAIQHMEPCSPSPPPPYKKYTNNIN